jgi:hypothetical protein
MKKNQPTLSNRRSSKIKSTAILITGAIMLFGIGTFPEQGLQMLATLSSRFFKEEPKNNKEALGYNDEALEYGAVKDPSEPSYLFLIDKFKSAGLTPNPAEISVHRFSDSVFNYRWNQAGKVRKWEVYKDHAGNWISNEIP